MLPVADASLGVTDDAPILRATLMQPNEPNGVQGDPYDLTGATVNMVIAPKDKSAAVLVSPCTVLDQVTDLGGVTWDYAGLDTTDAKDFDFRFKGTLASGKKFSVPNDGWYTLSITADPG